MGVSPLTWAQICEPYLVRETFPEGSVVIHKGLFVLAIGEVAFLCVPKVRADEVGERPSLDVEDLFHGELPIQALGMQRRPKSRV